MELQSKQSIHSALISDLWNAYRDLDRFTGAEPLTSVEYEKLIFTLHARAQETRHSVNLSRIMHTFEDMQRLGISPTVSTSLMAITTYGRTGRMEQVSEIVTALRSRLSLDTIRECGLYEHYLEASLFTGRLNMASQILKDMKKIVEPAAVCTGLAHFTEICTKKGNLRKAIPVLESFSLAELTVDSVSLRKIVAYLRQGYEDLLKIRNQKDDQDPLSIEIPTDTTIALSSRSLFTAPRLHLVVELLTEVMPNLIPTTKTCEMMLDVYATENNFTRCSFVLRLMQKHNIQPSLYTTSVMLKTFGTSLSSSDTQVLYDMLSKSHDTNVYSAFIHLYANMNATSRAECVYEDMKRQNLTVSADSHSAIVQSYIRQGQMDRAMEWLNSSDYQNLAVLAVADPMDTVFDPYAAVMETWLERGEWKLCIEHYEAMESEKMGHALHRNRRIVKAAVAAACAQADWDKCELMLKKRKIEFTPATITRIVNKLMGLSKDGSPAVPGASVVRSIQALEQVLDIRMTAANIARIIKTLGERKQGDDAYKLYRWVRGQTSIGKGNRPIKSTERCSKPAIYLAMIEAASHNSDIRKAERAWYDLAYRSQFKPGETCFAKKHQPRSFYNMLLNAYAARIPQPSLTRAKKAFERMLEAGLSPTVVTYNTLIKSFVNAGKLETAYQIFATMLQSGTKPNSWTTNAIIRGLVDRRDWSTVEKFVKTMRNHDERLEVDTVTFNLLIQGFLRLDPRLLQHERILLSRRNWKQIRLRKTPYPLSSDTIWDIFESAVGHKREEIENSPPSEGADMKLSLTVPPGSVHEIAFKLVAQGIEQKAQENQEQKPQRGTMSLFGSPQTKLQADATTYRHFIRAFINAGDQDSAEKVLAWRKRCEKQL
ncbi:hypothetical protein DFQ29_006647 [Apophysomyces sp. BC1021]|nr:hypothetical protein DFQ29_006647 [Apophysomyces sp. BC1021]